MGGTPNFRNPTLLQQAAGLLDFCPEEKHYHIFQGLSLVQISQER
jgi:hypothetical protein